jgi:hypothetical protein
MRIQVRDLVAMCVLLTIVVCQDGLRDGDQIPILEVPLLLEGAVGAAARVNDLPTAGKYVAHAGNVELSVPLRVVRVEVPEEEDDLEAAVERKPMFCLDQYFKAESRRKGLG